MCSHTVEGIGWLVLARLADSIAVVILECARLTRFAEGSTVATEALVSIYDALLALFTCLVALACVDFTGFTGVNGVITAPVV